MKKLIALTMTTFILFSCCACEKKPGTFDKDFPTVSEEPLFLSKSGGVYENSFVLQVAKEHENHKIYYTTDGSFPTVNSSLYEEKQGIFLSDETKNANYPLSKKSVSYYNGYKAETVHHATPLRLIEVDEQGKVISSKTQTYLIKNDALSYFTIPIVCITSDYENFYGTDGMLKKANWDSEEKYDMTVEYYDGENSFVRPSKIKLGGNWTKYNFPNKTFNVNMKKNEFGEKNEKIGFSIFGDEKKEDESGVLGSTKRFRLHSGANDCFNTLFVDAFVQRMSEDLNVSTTAHRPCLLYLNGEFWGVYSMREWYSSDYFADNYGVKSDNVLYVDRTTSAFDKPYSMEIKDGDETPGYKLVSELMNFCMTTDFSKAENYEKLCSMVDMESLADMVLVHEYVGNWDFMYNNLRMWRTFEKEEGNPYGDTRWRFCLQDLDFSFENEWADFGLPVEDRGKKSYLDFFLEDSYLQYNNYGTIPRRLNCFFVEPFRQSEAFRTLFQERATVVRSTFAPNVAKKKFDEMVNEIAPLIGDHAKRWKHKDFSEQGWKYNCKYKKSVIEKRAQTFDEDILLTLQRYK